jgi:hypothetical protein
MVGAVVGGVQRRHERKRTLGRIPLGFVVDVVKDETVEAERTKTSDCDVGDLLCSFAIRRETRRGESKEQELPLAGINAADQIHGRDGIGSIKGSCGRGHDARGLTKSPFGTLTQWTDSGGNMCHTTRDGRSIERVIDVDPTPLLLAPLRTPRVWPHVAPRAARAARRVS